MSRWRDACLTVLQINRRASSSTKRRIHGHAGASMCRGLRLLIVMFAMRHASLGHTNISPRPHCVKWRQAACPSYPERQEDRRPTRIQSPGAPPSQCAAVGILSIPPTHAGGPETLTLEAYGSADAPSVAMR